MNFKPPPSSEKMNSSIAHHLHIQRFKRQTSQRADGMRQARSEEQSVMLVQGLSPRVDTRRDARGGARSPLRSRAAPPGCPASGSGRPSSWPGGRAIEPGSFSESPQLERHRERGTVRARRARGPWLGGSSDLSPSGEHHRAVWADDKRQRGQETIRSGADATTSSSSSRTAAEGPWLGLWPYRERG